MKLRTVSLVLLVALSSGCVQRYVHNQIDGSWYDNKLKRDWFPPVEVAVMTDNLPVGPGAVALSLELATQHFELSAFPPFRDWQSLIMQSVMVGGRFYPLNRGPVLPYGGGGFGRTRVTAEWEESPSGFDPLFRCVLNCTQDFRDSIVSGYHPYLVGGVELRPGFLRPSLVLEYRRDFDRGDDFYRLSGHSYSVGLRWRL